MTNIPTLTGLILLLSMQLLGQDDKADSQKRSYIHHLGNDLPLTVENSIVLVSQNEPLNYAAAVDEKKSHSWTYRLRGEFGFLNRGVIHAVVIPGLKDQPWLLKIGGGLRFTTSWAQGDAHPYYGFISSVLLNYTSFSTKDSENRELFFEGIEIAVERRQWKIGEFLILDVGGAVLPWTRLKRKNDILFKTPYLNITVGAGMEMCQYFTILFNADRTMPMWQHEGFLFSVVGLTFRTLL